MKKFILSLRHWPTCFGISPSIPCIVFWEWLDFFYFSKHRKFKELEFVSRTAPRILVERKYNTQLAGKSLEVSGLGWQQQDTSVGACATIALWTALNSSAFDDHYSIPTTAEITSFANKTASLGSRIFPSEGLTIHQMGEAIKENKLSPVLIGGDIENEFSSFSKERFLSSVRVSGCYPLGGRLGLGRMIMLVYDKETE